MGASLRQADAIEPGADYHHEWQRQMEQDDAERLDFAVQTTVSEIRDLLAIDGRCRGLKPTVRMMLLSVLKMLEQTPEQGEEVRF